MIAVRPRTLAGWLITVMLVALAASQLVTIAAIVAERRLITASLQRDDIFRQIDGLVELVISRKDGDSRRTQTMFRQRRTRLSVDDAPTIAASQADRQQSRSLGQLLTTRGITEVRVAKAGVRPPSPRRTIIESPIFASASSRSEILFTGGQVGEAAGDALYASLRTADGRWINVSVSIPPAPPFASTLIIAAVLSALCLVATVIWAARRLTRPLQALAMAAERVGSIGDHRPIQEVGPDDIRRVTRAFNSMTQRVQNLLRDQQQLLRSIGHDVRTPLSSLRIRAEFVGDPDLRDKMVQTIEQIEQLTGAALEAARGGAVDESERTIALTSLVEAICIDAADLGQPVRFGDSDSLVIRGRSAELRRAVQNLIDNAVLHGGGATVRVLDDHGSAVVEIRDRGPGIPEEAIGRAVEPFVRLDEARTPETAGHGLGLTIVKSIAERHGGSITLANQPGGGLRVELRLPYGERG